jgi:hypothetical protein
MNPVRLIPFLMVFSASSFACEMYQTNTSNESVLFHSESGICFSLLEGIEYTANKLDGLYDLVNQNDSEDYSTYWEDWVLQSETNPILTRSLASNYIGVGVWVPSELENRLHNMDTEEWILSHGVQLSLGFGSKSSGEPRMRLDYRWHEKFDGDVMMQVEVPF